MHPPDSLPHPHVSATAWLGRWVCLVRKGFLGKEGAAEAKRALRGGSAATGKCLALSGRGAELPNTSPPPRLWMKGEGAGRRERRGAPPFTFPFVQALQERLQLLLVEDRALRVPLPQHHPGLLQPGDLEAHGADGRCWGHRALGSQSAPRGAQPGPGAVPPHPCTAQRLLPPKPGTSPAPSPGSGCVPAARAPRQQRRSGPEDERQGGAAPPPLCGQEAKTSQLGSI